MDIHELNNALAQIDGSPEKLFPRLQALKKQAFVFKFDFGLEILPLEPGILMIRGARQYGKSTWLEQQIAKSVQEYGPGSTFYLNGEYIPNENDLEKNIKQLLTAFSSKTKVKRIFIDEITALDNWEIVLKRMFDRGLLNDILIITTGSSATDLRRGAEKLPGRKGKLQRSNYLFTPISYKEFHRVCAKQLKSNTLITYLLSGGSPIACAELAANGTIPEYVISIVRDWIDGEIARSKRNRSALLNILQSCYRFGGTPVGQAKLARESGLANNTIAAGYIEILNDLGVLVPSYPWDQHRNIKILRKACKYHFINLLAAIAYHPKRIRSIKDFNSLDTQEKGVWYEWLIAQEISRRQAIEGTDILSPLAFWQNKNHELDFVVDENKFIEVKSGKCTALEFSWFVEQFPKSKLYVINQQAFKAQKITGSDFEDFLLDA